MAHMQTGTLADTINGSEEMLPDFLAIGSMEGMDAEAFFEAYDNSPAHRLQETAGIRKCMTPFFAEKDEDELDFDTFNAEGYNTLNIDDKEFNRELAAFNKGAYVTAIAKYNASGNAAEKAAAKVDERPEFDPNASDADPMLKALYRIAQDQENNVVSIAESVEEKYYEVYDVARRIASGRALKHHAFICGDAGIGKSYSVTRAIAKGQEQWTPNKRDRVKPEYFQLKGSIGNSMSSLVLFFYKHRKGELILLDDADGFLKETNQNVQNFLKGILDPDMSPVSTPSTIRKVVNKALQAENAARQMESVSIAVDTNRLYEGRASVNVNGNVIEFDVSEEDAEKLAETFGGNVKAPRIREEKRMSFDRYGRIKFNEMNLDLDTDDMDGDDEYYESDEDYLNEEIPEFWQFTSSLVLISNLRMSEVNEAVRSRCDCVEITLTHEEFLYRAEQIIDSYSPSVVTSVDQVTLDWAKKESFAIFKAVIVGKGFKNLPNIPINVPLEFRLIATITGRWLARYDRWCEMNGRAGNTPKDYQDGEKAILAAFIKFDLTKILAGDTRGKK